MRRNVELVDSPLELQKGVFSNFLKVSEKCFFFFWKQIAVNDEAFSGEANTIVQVYLYKPKSTDSFHSPRGPEGLLLTCFPIIRSILEFIFIYHNAT